MKEWIEIAKEEPKHNQRILATDGNVLHTGVFDDYTGKFHLGKDLQFFGGCNITTLEDHYSHWMPAPELPHTLNPHTMQKTDNRLMEARYKVVALSPMVDQNIGEIIKQSTGGIVGEEPQPVDSFVIRVKGLDGDYFAGLTASEMNQYPAIFRKLEWWQERTAEEMPEYVKLLDSGKVAKVDYYDMRTGWVFLIDPPHKDMIVDIQPSTLEEYTSLNRK